MRELASPSQIVAARGGVVVCDAQRHVLLSTEGEARYTSLELTHHETERPVYSLHQVVLDGDDAFGVWSWSRGGEPEQRGYALRRWNIKTGVIAWSRRLWREHRVTLSASYVAVYYELGWSSMRRGKEVTLCGCGLEQETKAAKKLHSQDPNSRDLAPQPQTETVFFFLDNVRFALADIHSLKDRALRSAR